MLKDILVKLAERQRHFLLLRIVGTGKEAALSALDIPQGTYNRWTNSKNFQAVHSKLNEYAVEYKSEALTLLRDVNYALVVNLEAKMLTKLMEEVDNGVPIFSKTNLAREIYSKLSSEMSTKQEVKISQTWEQLILGEKQQLPQGDNGDNIIEAEISETKELTQGNAGEDNTQPSPEVEEEALREALE